MHIINFQSHANTYIELDPGLNILIGESDKGKTSIIRALRWLFYNEPRGTSFFRVGENKCEVTALLANGTKVTRLRDEGKRQNRYIINYPNGKEAILERFGNEVPLEVQEELGVSPLWVDNDLKLELNIARQLDPPFLMEQSPANRAKIIGRIANLHIIDAAQRDLLRDTRNLSARRNHLAGDIENLSSEVEDYADIPFYEIILANVKDKLDKIAFLEENAIKLEGLKNEKAELTKKILVNTEKLASLVSLNDTEELLHNCIAQINYYNMLGSFYDKRINLITELNNAVKVMEKLNHLDETEKVYEKSISLIKLNSELHEINKGKKMTVTKLSQAQQIIVKTPNLDMGETIIARLYELRYTGYQLQETKRLVKQINKETLEKNNDFKNLNQKLKDLDEIDKASENLSQLNVLHNKLQDLLKIYAERQLVRKQIGTKEDELGAINLDYKQKRIAFIKLLEEAGTCPTCNSHITAEVIKNIADKTAI